MTAPVRLVPLPKWYPPSEPQGVILYAVEHDGRRVGVVARMPGQRKPWVAWPPHFGTTTGVIPYSGSLPTRAAAVQVVLDMADPA